MGFVRVSGYNQTDMDNNYQAGMAAADARVNPDSASYSAGYSAGADYVVANPQMVSASNSLMNVISAQWEDTVDIHIRNNSSNTLGIIMYGDPKGDGETMIKTLNGVNVGALAGLTLSFPPNGDFRFYQEPGSISNGNGVLFITVIGNYSNYSNTIYYNDDQARTYGEAVFT